MNEDILELVSRINTPGFFVTADVIKKGDKKADSIELFIRQKLNLILSGTSGRKFAYRSDGWQIYFTFFPTNQVVDSRYAMMNKMIKVQKKIK